MRTTFLILFWICLIFDAIQGGYCLSVHAYPEAAVDLICAGIMVWSIARLYEVKNDV